jgi:hypothetical protein
MFARCVAALCFAAGLALGDSHQEKAPKDFTQRVQEYVKLRAKVVKGPADLKAKEDSDAIHARKLAAREAIRNARPDARQGDIFTPAAQKHIARIIKTEFKGKASEPVKDTAKQGNPVHEGKPFAPKVNHGYPEDAPLSSVPPTLLARLPELPKELEYRLVGRHLILHDVESSLIVDFMPNALP